MRPTPPWAAWPLVRFAVWLTNYWPQLLTALATVGIAVFGSVLRAPQDSFDWAIFLTPFGLAFVGFALLGVLGNVSIAMRGRALSRLLDDSQRFQEQVAALEEAMQQTSVDYKETLRLYLSVLASTLDFGRTERISVYGHDGRAFVMLGRYSKNPDYDRGGRTIYHDHEGCIAIAWRQGHACIGDLPDPDTDFEAYSTRQVNEWHMGEETVRNLRMRSRSYAAYALEDLRELATLAVVVCESTRTGVLDCDQLARVVRGEEFRRLVRLLETLPALPRPTYAFKEGF